MDYYHGLLMSVLPCNPHALFSQPKMLSTPGAQQSQCFLPVKVHEQFKAVNPPQGLQMIGYFLTEKRRRNVQPFSCNGGGFLI
jgi:hypothetical protein